MASAIRVAVEGCGHGTLHSIYASVAESARIKGWEGVDLLIIGGDFQAVRNKHDLSAASMPEKYKRMADFHEYYSGARKAPYPTVFIGGNHEASNYLFELYYGGWVAPNIYYMGAANILRLGPLRIAGLSGIWKGYDYRKPHFERLPYNRDEISSIYHVRELDARKLLSVRTQVDIGLSHDWPQGVEWLGDHAWLFECKNLFEADARDGKLGSVAAKQCLARLRPAHWFSAHLHIKYAAIVKHPDYEGMPIPPMLGSKAPEPQRLEHGANPQGMPIPPALNNKAPEPRRLEHGARSVRGRQNNNTPVVRQEDRQQISAWGQFHAKAQKEDAEENARALQEQQRIKEEEKRTGVRQQRNYVFNETFKQVKTDDSLGRAVTSVVEAERSGETESKNGVKDEAKDEVKDDTNIEAKEIPQHDGCMESKPSSLKRQQPAKTPSTATADTNGYDEQVVAGHGLDPVENATKANSEVNSTVAPVLTVKNPDVIDLAMSSDDESDPGAVKDHHDNLQPSLDGAASAKDEATTSATINPDAIEVEISDDEDTPKDSGISEPIPEQAATTLPTPNNEDVASPSSKHQACASLSSDPDEEGGVSLNPAATPFQPIASVTSVGLQNSKASSPATTSNHSMEKLSLEEAPSAAKGKEKDEANEVSAEMRDKLSKLNPSFAKKESIEVSAVLPFPEGITNKVTQFLALDKCERNRHCIQLLEIKPMSNEQGVEQSRPYKLQYDPEWLAIQRVYAAELKLGGGPMDRGPQHRGDTYYRDRIIEEEKYIKENVVNAGLIEIPDNFSVTAPVYDPKLRVPPRAMPREVTNPQTSAFCSLIGIENPFDITEEERDARIARGPRPEQPRFGGGRGGGGRGRSGFGSRGGGGGRGGFNSYCGGGRGRGRW